VLVVEDGARPADAGRGAAGRDAAARATRGEREMAALRPALETGVVRLSFSLPAQRPGYPRRRPRPAQGACPDHCRCRAEAGGLCSVRGGCNLRSTAAYAVAAPSYEALINAEGDEEGDEFRRASQTVLLPLRVYAGDESAEAQRASAERFAELCGADARLAER
jgi:hypothetical protein